MVRKACKGCIYRARYKGDFSSCDYMYQIGIPRGCPAGEGCTRYQAGDQGNKKRHDIALKSKKKRTKKKAASSTAILKAAQPKLFQLHYSSIKGDLSI